jgi:hypothetical protein
MSLSGRSAWPIWDGHHEHPTRAEQPQSLVDFGLQTEQHVTSTPRVSA